MRKAKSPLEFWTIIILGLLAALSWAYAIRAMIIYLVR